MEKIFSTLHNLSNIPIELQIINLQGKTIGKVNLNPDQCCILKMYNDEYLIRFLKIGDQKKNKKFKIHFFHIMFFINDLNTNEYNIIDYIRNIKYRLLDLNEFYISPNPENNNKTKNLNQPEEYKNSKKLNGHQTIINKLNIPTPFNGVSANQSPTKQFNEQIDFFSYNLKEESEKRKENVRNNSGSIVFYNEIEENYDSELNEEKVLSNLNKRNSFLIFSTLTKNTLNSYELLHRDNLQDELKEKLIKENEIKIINDSLNDIFVMISDKNNLKRNFEKIENGSSKIFSRTERSIYKVTLVNNPQNIGPVYNILSGCIYIFNKNNNLIDLADKTLINNYTNYENSFELKEQIGIFYEKNDESYKNFIEKNNIILVNKSMDSILIKLECDNTRKQEDWIELEPFLYLILKRKEGRYSLSSVKRGQTGEENKYLLETNHSYTFDDGENEFYDSLTGEKLRKNFFDLFVTKKFINKLSNLYLKKKEEGNSINIKLNIFQEIWEKFQLKIKNQLTQKIKNFNFLLFNFIEIKNFSVENIYVRMKCKKIGSEDFILIESQNFFSWKRLEGEYLVEIIKSDYTSKRFTLQSEYSYYYDPTGNLINSTTNQPLEETQQMFGGNSLVYFDIEKNDYLTKKINYNENELLQNDNSTNEETLEYFNGIKPVYIEGEKFTDENFPPDKSSLSAIDPKTNIKRKAHFQHAKRKLSEDDIQGKIQFQRPSNVFNKQFYLYKDDICYQDVKQGSIGDCYLMSVIASLSQRPELIKKIFKSKTINPDGFYEIYYYEKGVKKIMFIDDNIPTVKNSKKNQYWFAIPNGEELWAMLLEKAYAKYEGGYSNIIGGLMYPEFGFFTGIMTKELKIKDDICWSEIVNACRANHILTTASKNRTGNHFKSSEKGISNGHAYSILNAKEYPDDQSSLRLLKIRNPWGNSEWTGDYSDHCEKWTTEKKRFFGFGNNSGDDGIFFMKFEDFINEFEKIVICFIDLGENLMKN